VGLGLAAIAAVVYRTVSGTPLFVGGNGATGVSRNDLGGVNPAIGYVYETPNRRGMSPVAWDVASLCVNALGS